MLFAALHSYGKYAKVVVGIVRENEAKPYTSQIIAGAVMARAKLNQSATQSFTEKKKM